MSSAVKHFEVLQAESPAQVTQARELFLEYAKSLNFDLCFQNFEAELANLPGDYAPPSGRLLLAEQNCQVVGCVALHAIDQAICEMKRLYLRPQARGQGLGRLLTERIISEARAAGYKVIRLDTVGPVMQDAVALYRKLGFEEIAAYRINPNPGTLYLELKL